MIQKINLHLANGINRPSKNQAKSVTTPNFGTTQKNEIKASPELLKSYYVSFGANKNGPISEEDKLKEIESNVSYYGEELLDNAKTIALEHGHSEVSHIHVLQAGLESLLDYIEELDSGIISYNDDTSLTIPDTLENEVGKNIFKDEDQRKLIKPVIEKEIEVLDKKLNEMPKSKEDFDNPKMAKDLLNEIYSEYLQENEEDAGGDGLVHDATIFSSAIYPLNDKLKQEITVPFITALKDEIQIDKRTLKDRVHLSFYDQKAENIWKNLSIGTNMAILHDKETSPGYLVNSLLHVFENSENGFGKLNKNNTEIINFNDNDEIDNKYFRQKIKQLEQNKDKNYIIIMSIMDRNLASTSLGIDSSNIDTFIKAPKNIKFVMAAEKDSYYKESTDSDLKGFFTDFGEISLPLMNMTQAQKMFLEQPKLTEKIKKHFTNAAIEKSVELANNLKGNYPEKGQKVMELVAAYYVDKDEITPEDVMAYANEAKEIFKTTENDSSIKTVLDTGVKLNDMVGTPSTKKEAQSIVNSIKDKTIGTKGFIIYSQDGSVGAGRKYTARAIAGETKSPYIEINAVDFGTKDVDLFGSGNLSPEASMKKLFGIAKSQAEATPTKSAVLFIENFEYFSYGEMVSEYHEKAMSQLIREMNKAQEQGLNIIVMGSMNNPEYIGDATTKSFKFIDKIEIESPGRDPQARAEIIDYYINKKGIKLAGDLEEQENIKKHINLITEWSSYIEILTLLDKAKNVAKERNHERIDKADFTEAYLQLTTGRPSSAQDPVYRKETVTSHECGHALNATIMEELAEKEGNPSHKGTCVNFITLDPRGSFGGAVFTADMINPEYSFEHVFSDIVCDFGGNSCEKHFYGQDGSWGITCDMEMATNSATQAAAIMGQGKHFGKKSISGMWFMSEKDKDNMNEDIDVILNNARLVSEAITEVYEDFNKEFTKKYSSKVGTGECIIHREEFLEMLNEWRAKQSPEKQKEFELLDQTILEVIKATKRGVKCQKEGE